VTASAPPAPAQNRRAKTIALLGAESTGKSRLAHDLASALSQRGLHAVAVPEVLRAWCEREGRTPRPEEQLAIAREQERCVDVAAGDHDVVIADTTALMVAIHAGMLFPDGPLLRLAMARQRSYDATLVTGLDLPWVADGLQRDGPHVQGPIDAQVRAMLGRAALPYRVVYGNGSERVRNALAAIDASLAPRQQVSNWVWQCDKCSDPDCEHRLFTRLQR
jgi:nicotinamide riboside kinase